ncbi:MAG TPA: hypothetical protein PKC28_12235 [Bdellovibrionales bacterium]|nr:hypothetical protein [Bdellovibrionales bacterium]
MTTQVNWQKVRAELTRLANVDTLKAEVTRIGTELRNFDYQKVLSPAAQDKMKAFEKRYSTLMRTIHQAQRQMDREFNRLLRQVNVQRKDVNKTVTAQRAKLEKVSADFRKRFSKSTKTAKRKSRTVTRKRKA